MHSLKISKLPLGNHLITNKSDLFYLTGVELEGFWLLVADKKAVVFAPQLLAGQLKRLLPGLGVAGGDNLIELLVQYCKREGLKGLGVCASKMSHSFYVKLNRKINLKDEGDVVVKIRQKKDAQEISKIARACQIASSAMRYAKSLLKPGVTEEEIVFKIEEYFAKNRVRPSFPIIVGTGPNSANPHHISGSRKIAVNDTVLIDLGCVYKGYCSDLTRTFFLGKTNDLQQKAFTLVKRAHGLALLKAGQGVAVWEVDKAARDVISQAGYGDKFIHTTGHGVGIDIHESPRLSAKDDTVLKSGMVVTIEPGIYFAGRFGIRIEDTILIKKKGRKVLTRTS
jgi:Xaa-Pro aminopeptidase